MNMIDLWVLEHINPCKSFYAWNSYIDILYFTKCICHNQLRATKYEQPQPLSISAGIHGYDDDVCWLSMNTQVTDVTLL